MNQIILCDRDNYKQVETEARTNYIRNVIVEMGVPVEELWEEDKFEFSTEEKINLRILLSKFNILILDDGDGNHKIYVDQELVSEWKKPRYEFHTDLSQVDPSKKIYVKVFVDYWDMFEKEE